MFKLGVVMFSYNPSTQNAEPKDGEFGVSLNYIANLRPASENS